MSKVRILDAYVIASVAAGVEHSLFVTTTGDSYSAVCMMCLNLNANCNKLCKIR